MSLQHARFVQMSRNFEEKRLPGTV